MPLTPSTLSAFTNEYFIRKLVDNFFLSSALLFKLRQNEVPFDGGRPTIQQPISYGNSPNAGAWGGGSGTLPTTFVDVATQATFNICNYYASITIPWTEEMLNAGEWKIVDLVKAQTELVEQSLKDTMGQDVYSDGSNSTTGAITGYERLDGMQAICTYNADPTPRAYGGITRVSATGSKNSFSNYAWWNANSMAINAGSVTRWKGTDTISSANTNLSLAKMQSMYGFCTAGNEVPTLIVASQAGYNAYWGLLQVIQRQASDEEIGRAGFKSLLFDNTPVVVDDNIDAASKMYFLNTDHIYLRPHKKANFYTTDFRQPPNQIMNIMYILWMGQLTCDRPNLQGVFTGITY